MDSLIVIQTMCRLHSTIAAIDAKLPSPDASSTKLDVKMSSNDFKAALIRVSDLLQSAAKEMKSDTSKSAILYHEMTLNTLTFEELKAGALQAIASDIGKTIDTNKAAIRRENELKLAKAFENVTKSEARLKADKATLARAEKRIKLMEYAEKTFS